MKSKLFLLITLVLVSLQAWAIDFDSSSHNYIDKSKGFERIDDAISSDGLEPDGVVFDITDFIDLVTPGQTTEATSSTTNNVQTASTAPIIASMYFYCASTARIKIQAQNLSAPLRLSIRGTGKSYFSVNPKYISIANAKKGIWVNVGCNPTYNLQRATAYLDVSYSGTVISTFRLVYVKNQMPQISSVEPGFDNAPVIEAGNVEISPEVWSTSNTGLDDLTMNSRIYAEGQNIIIESPVDQSAIISDISGRAKTVSLQAGRNEIPVNASGIYIVRIGEKTTKLMLR